MSSSSSSRPSLAPRNWIGWLAVAVMWLLARVPPGWARGLSRPLGNALRLLLKRRRTIAERNLERCFPEQSPAERKILLARNFEALAMTLFESAWCWGSPPEKMLAMGEAEGLEHIEQARASGRGALLLTAHMTCLELGGALVGLRATASAIYRPLKTQPLEWYQNRGRSRYAERMISKRDIRSAIRHLRRGGVIWYAPDQDFGPRQSVFVPFFGIEAATLLATDRLIRLTGCIVLPMFPRYDRETGRYRVSIHPPLEGLDRLKPEQVLARVNAAMESHVRSAPEQYWWVHRRFKTRPEGEEPFYGTP